MNEKDPRFWKSPKFLLLAGVSMLGAGLLLLAAGGPLEEHGLAVELVRDAGIACLVSVMVALLIEFTLGKELAERGIQVAMRAIVPPDIWDEIKDDLILQPVIRNDYLVAMDVARLEDGRCVSTTTVTYELESLTYVGAFSVHHELDPHRTGRDGEGWLPRYVKALVTSSRGEQPYEGGSLAKICSPEGNSMELPVHFQGLKDKVRITVVAKEVLRVPDTYSWWMPIATRKPAFKVTSAPPDLEFKVAALHPRGGRLEPDSGGRWTFPRPMLPGQALEIHTSVVGQPGNAGHAPSGA